MIRLFLISFLFLISCSTNESSNKNQEHIYIQLLEEYVQQDSIIFNSVIDNKVHPYTYYDPVYVNGTIAPAPGGGGFGVSYFNEQTFITYINSRHDGKSDSYFSKECDRDFLKKQTEIVGKRDNWFDVTEWCERHNADIDKFEGELHTFYLPLFNCDSTEVYLQYDYENGSYGEGNGAIFVKKNEKWILVKIISNWMT